jgi:hypothetical protein
MKISKQSEASFQKQVLALAKLKGWRDYHTHDSRRSAAGFPDLVLVRGERLIFAELKRDGGKPRPEQMEWLTALGGVGGIVCGHVQTFVWRPADWNRIVELLS